ncbi:MAG: hypothetical protein ACRCWJ_09595 [Casimicrobium sp.]
MSALPKTIPVPPKAAVASSRVAVGEIRKVFTDRCEVFVDGFNATFDAILALGSATPAIGQRAYLIEDTANDQWLIAALFPTYSSSKTASVTSSGNAPLMSFDSETRTLTLDATRMEIKALESIELRCGDARFRLTMQGAVQVSGETITSSAIGEHRIEGASIDLN